MLEAAILGIIQGLTEFLPISSSAHLVIVPEIFGWEEKGTLFDVFLHGGTLLAILVTYRKKIFEILKNKRSIVWNIIIATIPTLIIGAIAIKFLDSLQSNYLIVFMLVSVGILMIYVDMFLKTPPSAKNIEQVDSKKAIGLGFAQSIAYLRGTSRSGITIVAGRMSGLDLKTAIDYSFLLGIPIIAAGFTFSLLEIVAGAEVGDVAIDHLIIGFLSSFIFGIIAIQFMLKFLERVGLKYFGLYRIILAILLLIFLI